MKTLIIDNYDSFTYNLFHLIADINQEEPIVVYNSDHDWGALSSRRFDNIVISPGPGRPDRDADFGVSRDAIRHASVPLLGVCLGHQGIAASHGGAVVRAPQPVHGKTSMIFHEGRGIFDKIPSPFKGARYHSLIAARPLPECLRELARTADGLVMAHQHRDRPLWGVQFHPESILTEHGRRMLTNFRDITMQHAGRRLFAGAAVADPAPPRPAIRRRKAFWRALPLRFDTEAAFVDLYGDSPTAFWLDSSRVEAGLSRWSYLGDASGPSAELVQYSTADGRVRIRDPGRTRSEHVGIFEYLARNVADGIDTPPPCAFAGGFIGWLGYELRNEAGSATRRRANTPDALFIRTDRFIAVDHRERTAYVVAVADPEDSVDAEAWIEAMVARLDDVSDRRPEPAAAATHRLPLHFRLDRDRDTYLRDVEQCLEWIRQGESYQICLTNEIVCAIDLDPLSLYRVMRAINPAPYAAFVRWPGGAVLSCSPERFMTCDRDGGVETKPIKGTIARSADPATDRRLARTLLASEKDRAENAMIVDLLRNDLSRACVPGSVVVPKLNALESYATVHQLVSTVRGTLRPGRNVTELVRAAFPGGSMTGAPKIRTMELIDQLEGRARGVYSGALGWFGHDGCCDLSIVIRTVVATDGQLSMGVGGGVVAQSTPEGEFDEMLLKAKASIRAIVTAATGGFDDERYVLDGAASEVGTQRRATAQSVR
jgi:para-aminobenzoate synthetase